MGSGSSCSGVCFGNDAIPEGGDFLESVDDRVTVPDFSHLTQKGLDPYFSASDSTELIIITKKDVEPPVHFSVNAAELRWHFKSYHHTDHAKLYKIVTGEWPNADSHENYIGWSRLNGKPDLMCLTLNSEDGWNLIQAGLKGYASGLPTREEYELLRECIYEHKNSSSSDIDALEDAYETLSRTLSKELGEDILEKAEREGNVVFDETLSLSFRELWCEVFLTAIEGDVDKLADQLCEVTNIDTRTKDGKTLLMAGATFGHANVVQLLVEELGQDVNAVGKDGMTAIMFAAGSGKTTAVAKLIALNADVNAVQTFGQTAGHWAANKGHNETLKVLLENGLDVNLGTTDGVTPLIQAAFCKQMETVELLLHAKADPTLRETGANMSALDAAKMNKNERMIALLTQSLQEHETEPVVLE